MIISPSFCTQLENPVLVAPGIQRLPLAFQVPGTSSEVFPTQHHPLSSVWKDVDNNLPSQAQGLPPQDFPIKKPPKHHRGKSRSSRPHWGLQRILPCQSQLTGSREPLPLPTSPTFPPALVLNHLLLHLSGTQTKAKEAQPTTKNDASQQTK